jgi:hypothetical protein
MAHGLAPVELSGVVAGILVLGVVQGAYATEVLRGAIQAVPAGQVEAGRAFGMPPLLLMRRIVLPAMLPWPAGAGEPVADRHQGHRAAGRRRLCRTDAGDPAGGGIDAALFHLLPGRRGALPDGDAALGPGVRAARTLGAAGRAGPGGGTHDASPAPAPGASARRPCAPGCARTGW